MQVLDNVIELAAALLASNGTGGWFFGSYRLPPACERRARDNYTKPFQD